MCSVVLIEGNENASVFILPNYDEVIVNFLEEANNWICGSGILIIEEGFIRTRGMQISAFKEVESIINIFSCFVEDDEFHPLADRYMEVCDYIRKNYLLQK